MNRLEEQKTQTRLTRAVVLELVKSWWPIVLLLGCLLLTLVARSRPLLVERYYANGVYPLIARSWGALVTLLPFSLVELLITLAVLAVPVLAVAGVITLVRVRREVQYQGGHIFWRRLPFFLVRVICVLISMFILFCGLNYYRPSYVELSGLPVRQSSAAELAELCDELTERANALAGQVPRNEYGITLLSQDALSLCRQAREVFGGLSQTISILPDYPITPKPVVSSWAMSMAQITGVFCPITFEANVNIVAPPYLIPATACHELAHTRGIMREEEANFLGYLACERSGAPEFEYSGVMLALLHTQNKLYEIDREAFHMSIEQLSDLARRDFAYSNEYWARNEGVVAEVSMSVNNTYLQLNNQQDGVQSYGRMVDLLLADYRQRHGLE